MITGVFGLPRAGKTCFLTYVALRALRGKSITLGHFAWKVPLGEFAPYQRVFTNFPVYGCIQLDFDALGVYDFSNSLILIDEIMLLCDSRDWKNFPKRLRNFLALHGHGRTDLVYCSQGYSDTDLRFRNLTERIFYIQKSGSWSKIAPIEKTWRIDQDIAEGYTLAPPLGCTWIYRPRYYRAYNSFDLPSYKPNNAPLWSVPACSAASIFRCARCALRTGCKDACRPFHTLLCRRHEWRLKKHFFCTDKTDNSLTPIEFPSDDQTDDLRGVSEGGLSDTHNGLERLEDASDKWDFTAYQKPRFLAKIPPLKSGIDCNIDTVFLYVPYSRDFLPPV